MGKCHFFEISLSRAAQKTVRDSDSLVQKDNEILPCAKHVEVFEAGLSTSCARGVATTIHTKGKLAEKDGMALQILAEEGRPQGQLVGRCG